MAIILDEPVLPFDINQYYEEFLSFLATGNVYAQSRIMIPATKPAIGPSLISVVAQTHVGDTLAAGTYMYVIEAVLQVPDISGLITKETLISREVSVVIGGPNNSAFLTWQAYAGAVSYNIYRTQTSGDYRNTFIVNVPPSTTFLDTGYGLQLGVPLAQQVTLTGTFGVPGIFVAQLMLSNKNGDYGLFQEITTNPDGLFEFKVSIPYGSNSLFVTDGTNKSNTVYINANNLFAFFDMIANDLKTYWQELVERIKAGPHLFAVQDMFDGNTRLSQISDFVAFWQTMTSVFRPALYTDAQIRDLVTTVIEAYREATSFDAIRKIMFKLSSSTWSNKSFIPFDVYNYGFALKGRIKFRVTRVIGNPSLTVNWSSDGSGFTSLVADGIRGYLQDGSYVIPSQPGMVHKMYFYVDGTLDVNGYLVLKKFDTDIGPLTTPFGFPEGVLILAAVKVALDDIIWVSGQGYLGSTGGSFQGYYTGPYIIGPSFITDKARLNGRGYKYSRFIIATTGLGPSPAHDDRLQLIKTLLKEVKPAKTTILLGDVNDTGVFVEI